MAVIGSAERHILLPGRLVSASQTIPCFQNFKYVIRRLVLVYHSRVVIVDCGRLYMKLDVRQSLTEFQYWEIKFNRMSAYDYGCIVYMLQLFVSRIDYIQRSVHIDV